MGTTADKLKKTSRSVKQIREAISYMGGTPPAKLADFPDEIRALPTGGGARKLRDVNFFDYDGMLLYAFSSAEAAALTELPALPIHDGLVSQEWTHTLAEVKARSDRLDVGVTCATDDGKTRFYLEFEDANLVSVNLRFVQSVSNGVVIDWGDGSETETAEGDGTVTVPHTFPSETLPAKYTVTLKATEGTLSFQGSLNSPWTMGTTRAHQNLVRKIEIGSDVQEIGNCAFIHMHEAASVTIPNTVTSIGESAFSGWDGIDGIVIPRSMTVLSYGLLTGSHRLRHAVLPGGVTQIKGHVFDGNYALWEIVIPKSVKSIGTCVFENSSFRRLVLPEGLETLGESLVAYNRTITDVVLPSTLYQVWKREFSGCYALHRVTLPDRVPEIPMECFQSCLALTKINMPRILTVIGDYAFNGCNSLMAVGKFPSGLTSVGQSAFFGCSLVKEYDFTALSAVPTCGSKAFQGIASDCQIKVPAALYDTWVAAENWSTWAANIVAV